MEENLIRSREFVMLGIQPWDIEIGCNFKDMAIEISKHYKVLYVNRPLDRFTLLKNRSDHRTKNRLNSIKSNKGVLHEVKSNLWVFNPRIMVESINWLPSGSVYRYMHKRNNRMLAEEIMKATKLLQFQNPLLIIDNDFFNGLYLNDYLRYDSVTYYLRDNLLAQRYFFKHGKNTEPEILQKVDIVATNSLYLEQYAAKYNTNSHYIGQGCDIEDFMKEPSEFPADIRSIKKPVIGYCGALLSLRLDEKILIGIAEHSKDWNLVLIGPEDDDFKKSRLHTLPNVHFLGLKKPSELAAYVHYFDVCINPQIINPLTIGNYPRKIDEYLSAGKPVVATETLAMQEFMESSYLCKTIPDFIEAINSALGSANDVELIQHRRDVAMKHTWTNSIRKLYKEINKLMSI